MNAQKTKYFLLAILVVGALLRLSAYDACSYANEEIVVINTSEEKIVAESGAWDALVSQALYLKLLVQWRTVFATELWDRLPSLLFGIAAIWLTYLFVAEVLRFATSSGEIRKTSLRYAPLFAAVFVALNPALISLSWQLNPYALLPAIVALSMLAFAKVLRESFTPEQLKIRHTLPWLLVWLLVGVIGCAIHPYFALIAIGQAIASGFLLSRNKKMILPLVIFALMSASVAWMVMANAADAIDGSIFSIAHKADAQGLLKIFNAGYLVLSEQTREMWYGVAMLAAAASIFGVALFSLFFRPGQSNLRDFCLPGMIPALAVFVIAPVILLPMTTPALIVAIVPVIMAAAAGGVCGWGSRRAMAGMMIAVVLVSLIAFGFSLHERYAQPDYRPVAKHLNQNAGDAPVVHLSLETFKYVGIYHDDLVDQRWRPLWLASRPELRGSIIDAGGELFVVIESVLIDELYNGSAQDFLAQIMKSSWEVVDTTDLGAYTVYRIKKPKKNYPFEMGAT